MLRACSSKAYLTIKTWSLADPLSVKIWKCLKVLTGASNIQVASATASTKSTVNAPLPTSKLLSPQSKTESANNQARKCISQPKN